ncbi:MULTISPECIES: TlpA family protein disulfide reductase [Pseudoalteromonas]|uniref:TlpA disulfide reductase family protein n=1 Tax=Pseudoalteromonas obscura TaxID=3048491 RepID=A0ABT7EHL8_9GAMM|nr:MULTISPECIES: TlpA disulfide reductase family protein [Pseudoalteromonas]MBQ4836205.1 TlpA family protein disulfide reductase [Pseudoalteromonas luteoviolacea]MDK2594556.1 TlpA disulfide reductase family protein [Pseudoalteromonas sp. P94(2023)]
MIKSLFNIIIFVVVLAAALAYQELGMLEDDGKQSAPYFSLPTLADPSERYNISALQGERSVIYFFAPWCNICRYSMPNIDKLHRQGKVNAVAIALDFQSTEEITKFSQDLNLSMPILLGNQKTAQDYKVKAYPTYYVMDPKLKIIERSIGYSSELGIRLRL